MPVAINERGTVPAAMETAPSQALYPSNLAAGRSDFSAEEARIQSLRGQLARHRVELAESVGSGLLLSGAGFSVCAPDMRSAWVFLRTLNGGGRFA